MLEALAVQEAALFAATAVQLHATATLSADLQGPGGPDRVVVLDVAGTLRVGQGAAGARLEQACRLVRDLPCTLAGLAAGAVLVGQARQVLEHTRHTSAAVASHVDAALMALAAARPDGLAGWTGRLDRPAAG